MSAGGLAHVGMRDLQRGPANVVQNCRMRFWLTFLLMGCAVPAWAAHGYALWGEPRYPAGFAHFAYVNPDAPKGGELRLVSNLRVSTFDKYNPFTIKGNAPAYLSSLMFDSLLAGSMDETATFRLRPEARFHNGKPVLAQDVKHSYDTLVGPFTSPAYKTLLIEVAGVDVINDRTVRYRFK